MRNSSEENASSRIVSDYELNQTLINSLCEAILDNDLKQIKEILSFDPNVNCTKNIGLHNGMTPLFIAAGQGSIDIVKLLIEAKADVNISPTFGTYIGITPLSRAAQYGHVEVVRQLLETNADVNLAPMSGHFEGITPLSRAEQNGHGEITELLLQHVAVLDTSKRNSLDGVSSEPSGSAASDVGFVSKINYSNSDRAKGI